MIILHAHLRSSLSESRGFRTDTHTRNLIIYGPRLHWAKSNWTLNPNAWPSIDGQKSVGGDLAAYGKQWPSRRQKTKTPTGIPTPAGVLIVSISSGRDRTRNDAKSSEFIAGVAERAAQALHLTTDSDLEKLIEAWPELSEERRSCILAIAALRNNADNVPRCWAEESVFLFSSGISNALIGLVSPMEVSSLKNYRVFLAKHR
jgi:hypothetical protein